MDTVERVEIYKTAAKCRAFEEETYKRIKNKEVTIPVYLSAGQEFIAASLSHLYRGLSPAIFAQHRCHSTFLSFGGTVEGLVGSLLWGSTGSASLHCPDINMFGHDGLMGSQVPIAVGYCYATRKPTIAFMGDAAAEEDYVLSAIGWAATHNLPILFVVEDNNLSILTEVKVRRSWCITEVAKGFGMYAADIEDSPDSICRTCKELDKPQLINIKTNRLYWHSGAGKDSDRIPDRLIKEKWMIGTAVSNVLEDARADVKRRWDKVLEKQ